MKRFLQSVEGLVLAVLLISGATLPASAKDVKIGLLMPLSGRYAETGISVRRGVEMILKDVNAAGGIKSMGGAKVNLVVADNGSDPSRTSLEARRLITEEKVSFILGPYSTPESEAFRPIAERYKVGGVGLQTTMIPNSQYFTMLSLTADAFGKGYADFIGWLRSKGAKVDPVVITYANNDYGQVVAKSARESLQAMGIKVIEAIPVDPAVKDMTPIVLRVKSLNPALVISVVYFQDGVLLHKARYNMNYDDPIWIGGAAGFTDDKLWNALTDEVASKTLSRSFGLAFYSEDATLPGLKSALARGRAAYPNVQTDPSFVFGVQAANLIVKALENARSDDPAAVNDAFRSLRIPRGSPEIVLPIISGDFSFDKRGVIQGTNPLFVQWAAGRKAIVYPENIASLKKPIIKGVE